MFTPRPPARRSGLVNYSGYSPELNPVERVWAYLRSHYLSNRAYAAYDELLAAADAAWLKLDAQTLRSICRCSWIERAIQA